MDKRYNEMLDWVRGMYPNMDEADKRDAERFFPELAESEDERIRKGLIKYLKADMAYNPSQSSRFYDGALAYLEKRKEQKPAFPIPHKGDDNNPYDMGIPEAQKYAINRGFGIPYNDGEVYVDKRHMTQTIGNILRWADEHPKEQKPAEWSEEDEDKIESIKGLITTGRFADTNTIRTIWKLLDSLRPQPHWKPSEKQMQYFLAVINDPNNAGAESCHLTLESLYSELKKL